MHENKDKIIECAIKLFSLKGYEAVGVQEIVKTAGITKPTMYYYFKSKSGLLNYVLKIHFNDLIQKIITHAEYNKDIKMTLANIIKVLFRYAENNQDFYRMQLSMVFASPMSEARLGVKKYNNKMFSIIENVFKQAANDHGNMKGRHKRYAATFIGMVNTYIGFYFNDHIQQLNDEILYTALHQFMHGIFS